MNIGLGLIIFGLAGGITICLVITIIIGVEIWKGFTGRPGDFGIADWIIKKRKKHK